MRLVFLFTRDRDSNAESFRTEGLHHLFIRMLGEDVVEEIEVIIESYRHSGDVQYQPGYTCRMVQEITPDLLRPGDVVWVRGGFKPWLPFIDHCRQNHHWLLFYGANTGRERWPFWDIVFDDLSGSTRIDTAGRLWMDYRKPIHPVLFRRRDLPMEYDLCIGASHIHDHKGQWRGVKAAIAYRAMYGDHLRCIMPGAMRHGTKTNGILEDIRANNLDIEMPGMLHRSALASVLNRSCLFVHLGSGGQGDRGPIEAMSCGCPAIIGFPPYHAKWLSTSPYTWLLENPNDDAETAIMIRGLIQYAHDREKIAKYVETEAGIETQSLPMMTRLFDFFGRHPVAHRAALQELV